MTQLPRVSPVTDAPPPITQRAEAAPVLPKLANDENHLKYSLKSEFPVYLRTQGKGSGTETGPLPSLPGKLRQSWSGGCERARMLGGGVIVSTWCQCEKFRSIGDSAGIQDAYFVNILILFHPVQEVGREMLITISALVGGRS